MAFREALFWVGSILFGTGLYYVFEPLSVALKVFTVVLIVVGILAMAFATMPRPQGAMVADAKAA